MKKLFSFLAIIAIIAASNCSRIPENTDPVIGIWYKVEIAPSGTKQSQTIRQEWTFNDAYLGRYHQYNSRKLSFKTDFKWERQNGFYMISYPGTDMPPRKVSMKEADATEHLEDLEGHIVATRE